MFASMSKKQKVATAAGAVSAIMLALAPSAHASWRSSITDAPVGFESRRWTDSQYSAVYFKDCEASNGSTSTDVQYFRVVDLAPDPGYDNKTFTNCFKGDNWISLGEWHDLPSGNYYFQINKIGGGSSGRLDVYEVTQDDTAD